MDLGGVWRIAAATEDRRRRFHEFDFDDSGWLNSTVPGHWAQSGPDGPSELAHEESVLYRHHFVTTGFTDEIGQGGEAAPEVDTSDVFDDPASQRWWLKLEGIAQQGDVWLDGSYLGHTDGYFIPHELEVTSLLGERDEHLLAVEATCRRFGDPDNRTTLTGALQDPELCGSDDLIVGGIWRPVRLRSTGPTAIVDARVVCKQVRMGRTGNAHAAGASDASNAAARLSLRVVLDVATSGRVELRTRVHGTEHVHVHHAAIGENRVEWSVDVNDAPLWWPHALGAQPLFDLFLEAIRDGKIHDRRRFRIGFRSVEMKRWVLHVNGERLFVKGANLLPGAQLPGTVSPAEVAADVRAAREAGLDMVRPLAHVARPELYEAADELGILVWQDMPIRGVMNRSIASEARRQARKAMSLLGHHPSVALWCAHDSPLPRERPRLAVQPSPIRLGPSWNCDVFDRSLSRLLTRGDGSRPVVAHTAVPPRLPTLEGTTSHLWFGFRSGRAADLAPALAALPSMGRFVSAFGTPVDAQRSEVIKTTIETLRRLKYRPTGGFLLHALADVRRIDAFEASAVPETSATSATSDVHGGFGVLDAHRRPKPGWRALANACSPVLPVADPLPPMVRRGERLQLGVHVINDTRKGLDDLRLRARVIGPGDEVWSDQHWQGSVPADDCVLVGHIDTRIPLRLRRPRPRPIDRRSVGGVLTLELSLERPASSSESATGEVPYELVTTNRYETSVT